MFSECWHYTSIANKCHGLYSNSPSWISKLYQSPLQLKMLFAGKLQLNVPQYLENCYVFTKMVYTMHQHLKQHSEIFLTDLGYFGQGARLCCENQASTSNFFSALPFFSFSEKSVRTSATTYRINVQTHHGAVGCRSAGGCRN